MIASLLSRFWILTYAGLRIIFLLVRLCLPLLMPTLSCCILHWDKVLLSQAPLLHSYPPLLWSPIMEVVINRMAVLEVALVLVINIVVLMELPLVMVVLVEVLLIVVVLEVVVGHPRVIESVIIVVPLARLNHGLEKVW